MPRTTSLSNGRLYIAHDDKWSVRELCWPLVGHPNHLNGHKIRLGVWCGGLFCWTESEQCHVRSAAQHSQFSASALLDFTWMGLEVEVVDTVSPTDDLWVRRVRLHDLLGEPRVVRVFQSHDLRLRETDISDTAFFHPGLNGVVHYKDDVAASFTVTQGTVCGYACGMKGYGVEGTWRDAEDGHLSGKPIEQGTVDSTLGVEVAIEPNGESVVELENRWASSLYRLESAKQPLAEVAEEATAPRGLEDVSLDVLKSFFACGPHGAGLVAATDSDIMTTNRANYGSVWLRDHALNALTLLKRGEHGLVAESLKFGFHALHRENQPLHHPPVFAQKYLPNGRIGPGWHPWVGPDGPMLPWQEDETTLFVTLFGQAWEAGVEGAWREKLPEVFTICDYLSAQVDEHGLPVPSWDLWEERYGVHCWTTATTVEALQWAARLAEEAGDERSAVYAAAAEKMKAAFLRFFFGNGAPIRTLRPQGGSWQVDPTPDMSMLAALLRGPFRDNKELIVKTMKHCGQHLFIEGPVGGFARYAGDYYFRVREGYAGNPWAITTLWAAQAERAAEVGDGMRWVQWVTERASPTLMLSEQFHPDTGEPLSVMPLAWSHGELLETLTH